MIITGINIFLTDLESIQLRSILEQDARPGTVQIRLIDRIDTATEEAKRPRLRKRAE